MKKFLVGLLCGIVATTAFGGGPDVEIEKAHIDDVVVGPTGLVLRVTGTAKLYVLKTSEDGNQGHEAKTVTIPIESGEIRCFHPIMPFDKIMPWDGRDEAVLKLKGTVQHIQLWGATIIVEGAVVTHITASEAGAYPLPPNNPPDHAAGQH